jgi:hypothetical protein
MRVGYRTDDFLESRTVSIPMAPNAAVGVEPRVSSRASVLNPHLIQVSLACLILPNLPFWIFGTFLDIGSRGLFNLEYLGWACVALFLPLRFVVMLGGDGASVSHEVQVHATKLG